MSKKRALALLGLCFFCSPLSYALAAPSGGQHQASRAHYNNQVVEAVAEQASVSPEQMSQIQTQIQEIKNSLHMKVAQKGSQQKAALTEDFSIGFGAFMIAASISCYMTGVGMPMGVGPYVPHDINQEISQLVQSMGQMQSQIDEGAAEKEQASAQIMQATEQSLNQGVQQTENLAEQLRNSMNSIAQDMMSMVSATRV